MGAEGGDIPQGVEIGDRKAILDSWYRTEDQVGSPQCQSSTLWWQRLSVMREKDERRKEQRREMTRESNVASRRARVERVRGQDLYIKKFLAANALAARNSKRSKVLEIAEAVG